MDGAGERGSRGRRRRLGRRNGRGFVLVPDEPGMATVLTGPFQEDAALFGNLLQLHFSRIPAAVTCGRDAQMDGRLGHVRTQLWIIFRRLGSLGMLLWEVLPKSRNTRSGTARPSQIATVRDGPMPQMATPPPGARSAVPRSASRFAGEFPPLLRAIREGGWPARPVDRAHGMSR